MILDYFTNWSHRVVMSNVAQTVNVLQCLVKVDGPDNWTTPNLDIFEFYRAHVGNDAVPVGIDGAPLLAERGDAGRPVQQLSVSASVAPDTSSAAVCLTNLHLTEPISVRARVVEARVASANARVLTGASPQSHNIARDPDRVRSTDHPARTEDGCLVLEIPAHSTVQANLELLA